MSNSLPISSSNRSIVVLPFVNMSSDTENEYFSDGITEEIINALTAVKGLKVIARTSSFAFKHKNIDVRTIGDWLGVNTILEGSVRKFKNKVRITAQLISTNDGSHFWSKNFDRDLEDIFALQDEISLLIAHEIREYYGHFNVDYAHIYTILKQYNNAVNVIDEGVLRKEPLMMLLEADPQPEDLHNLECFKKQLQTILALSNESQTQTERTEKQLLSKDQITHYKIALESLMEKDIFIDVTLSLRTLANKIDIHPNHLSWLLNAIYKKNFNDFVNTYRLEFFKTIALKPEFKHLTILGLAYDSGFNSKTVFNTFFKKIEGVTPKSWLRSNQF